MKLLFIYILLIFLTFNSYGCGNLFLSATQATRADAKAAKRTIKESKDNIKSINKINSLDDLWEEEAEFLSKRFSYYLGSLDREKQLKVAQNILKNRELGLILNHQKKIDQYEALKLYSELSAKKKEKVLSIIEKYSLDKSKLKKEMEKILNKNDSKTMLRAIISKKICCLKTCKSCPVNYQNFKREQKAKRDSI